MGTRLSTTASLVGIAGGLTQLLGYFGITSDMVGDTAYQAFRTLAPFVTFASGAVAGWGLRGLRGARRAPASTPTVACGNREDVRRSVMGLPADAKALMLAVSQGRAVYMRADCSMSLEANAFLRQFLMRDVMAGGIARIVPTDALKSLVASNGDLFEHASQTIEERKADAPERGIGWHASGAAFPLWWWVPMQ